MLSRTNIQSLAISDRRGRDEKPSKIPLVWKLQEKKIFYSSFLNSFKMYWVRTEIWSAEAMSGYWYFHKCFRFLKIVSSETRTPIWSIEKKSYKVKSLKKKRIAKKLILDTWKCFNHNAMGYTKTNLFYLLLMLIK